MAHASAWSRVKLRGLLTNLLSTLSVGDFTCYGYTEKGSAVSDLSDFGPYASQGVVIKWSTDPIILPYTRRCCLMYIRYGGSTHYHVYRRHLYLR